MKSWPQLVRSVAVLVVSTAIAALIHLGVLLPWLGRPAPVIFIVLAVVASAAQGGLWFGLLATAIGVSVVGSGVSWAESASVPGEIARLALLSVGCVVAAFLADALHRSAARAEAARRALARESGMKELAERRLMASEARFRELVESFPDIMFVADIHGSSLYANQRWAEYSGQDRAQLASTHWAERLHPDDRDRVLGAWALAVNTGTHFEARCRLSGSGGEYRWFLVRARPVDRGPGNEPQWFGVATEIEAQIRAEAALRDRDEQLRLALESTGLGVYEFELWTRRVIWSERCRAICGFGESELLGVRRIRASIHPQDRRGAVRAFRNACDPHGTGEFAVDLRVVRPTGEVRWVAARGCVFFVSTADGDRAIRCIGTMLDITERRAKEEQLRRSEERLELAQEAAAVGMWDYDFADNVLQWSPTHHALFGSRRDAAANMLRFFWDAVVPADRRRLRLELLRASRVRGPVEAEYRIRRADGDERWIASRGRVEHGMEGRPVRFIGISTDITQAQQAKARLARSEELFRLAAEAVDGIIYEHDLERDSVLRTRGLFELLGYEPDTVPATAGWWQSIMHPDDRIRVSREHARDAKAGALKMEREYRARHKLGHWVTLLDRSVVIRDGSGRIARIIGCAEDITELRRVERSLREADRRKDEFLAVLAHELRNPLAPMRSALQIMEHTAERPDLSVYARQVLDRQLSQMVRLIDDLLDVARITAGKLALQYGHVPLQSLVESAVETVGPLIRERQHTLTISVPEAPVDVHCDAARISQVLSNLLNNAAKYTPIGGRISLRASVEVDEIGFEVRDNGIGIPPEMLESMFEMFSQGLAKPSAGHSGLGVGLPLARSLVALHDGRMEAHSEGAGRGTTVSVRLPRSVTTRPATVRRANAEAPSPARARRKVLVVDDNRDAAETLTALLTLAGHEVTVCHDGVQALEAAEATRPEVALLDIGMPRLDGHEVARRLRAQPWGRRMRIVALSGFGQVDDRQRSLDAGCDDHLIKPVSEQQLRQVLADDYQPAATRATADALAR
jgi:PAS domain S-box-containing protein